MNGIWLGPPRRWPAQSPLLAALPAADAGFLFYSGRWFEQDRPVASLRLKYLRQAAQTAAYLKLLTDLQSHTPADAIAAAMAKYALSEAASTVPGLGGPIAAARSRSSTSTPA